MGRALKKRPLQWRPVDIVTSSERAGLAFAASVSAGPAPLLITPITNGTGADVSVGGGWRVAACLGGFLGARDWGSRPFDQ